MDHLKVTNFCQLHSIISLSRTDYTFFTIKLPQDAPKSAGYSQYLVYTLT